MSSQRRASFTATGDINILLLGPTGVGKTTFINAFANYLVYNTLDEAMKGPLQAVIPAWFTMLDNDTFEEKTIIIGTPDDSEKKGSVGESCTRQCRSFVFRIGDRNLRLIDAPGVGDTQGILQDEKNFEDILAYIAQYDYLNGICILLKTNEERINILFRFCVKELLRHLHVHARQNLMFVFTSARTTQYELGATAPLLKKLLHDLRVQSNTDVPFSRDNTFTFDNEAFRFLSLSKNGIDFDSKQKEDYSRSWNYSIKEFTRLISRILRCDKHATRDTLSLNEAQQLIRKLSRPIAEISRLIQENIQLAEQHKNNIRRGNASKPNILEQNDAKVVRLKYPRTVCTSEKCKRSITVNGKPDVEYISHCHKRCFLVGVVQESIGDEKLKGCHAMDKKSYDCLECGCNWRKHMHITYEFQRFRTNVKMNSGKTAQSQIDAIENHIRDLTSEQEQMKKVCAQLSQFLQANALNPVNDDFIEYIEHFIREEEIKKNGGAQNEHVIAGLQNLLNEYRDEMNVFREGLRMGQISLSTSTTNLTAIGQPEDMFLLVGALYRLPINGPKIRAQVDELKWVQQKFSHDREQTVNLPSEASSTTMIDLKLMLS